MIKSKKIEVGIFAIIALLQVSACIYWAHAKQNYQIAEYYSFGYASTFTGKGDTGQYITVSPDWKFGEWIKNTEFKKYLVVSKEESVFSLPFFTSLKMLFTKRNYFWLLNMAESLYGSPSITNIPAIILNIVIFLLAELLLVKLMKKLGCDNRSALLCIGMFGATGYIIGFVNYVRFYILVTMILILIILLFHRIWTEKNIKKTLIPIFSVFILAYLSYKDSELTVAFFGGFCFFFLLGLLLTKQWKKIIPFIIMGLVGTTYVLIKTDLSFLLPGHAIPETNIATMIYKMKTEFSPKTIVDCFYFLSDLFKAGYFSSYYLFIVLSVIVGIYALILSSEENTGIFAPYIHKKKSDDNKESEDSTTFSIKLRPITVILTVFMLVIWIINRSSSAGIASLIGFAITIIYIFLDSIGKRPSIKKIPLGINGQFMVVLTCSTLFYSLFYAAAGLWMSRYYCFGFIPFTIIFWYVIDRLIKHYAPTRAKMGIYIILTIYVVVCALIPVETRTVEYLFEEDHALMRDIKEYRGLDVILVSSESYLTHSESYDCINIMSDNTRIYAVDMDSYNFDCINIPEKEFVLWGLIERDISEIMQDLEEHGYNIDLIGTTHCSKVYLCHK